MEESGLPKVISSTIKALANNASLQIHSAHLLSIMKLFTFLTCLLLKVGTAVSQTTFLAYPPSGINVTAGSQLTLEIARTVSHITLYSNVRVIQLVVT